MAILNAFNLFRTELINPSRSTHKAQTTRAQNFALFFQNMIS
jgi:hypothetical protein